MPVKLKCPHCDRLLRFQNEADARECDGCQGKFDLKSRRFVPAGPFKRIIGCLLILIGAIWLIGALIPFILSTTFIDVRFTLSFVPPLIIPILIMAWGGYFFKGSVAWDHSSR